MLTEEFLRLRIECAVLLKLMHIPASLLASCMCAFLVPSTYAGASHPKRDLARLTLKELRLLTTSPDPSRNVNAKSADSHLSKILIPRSRMCQPSPFNNVP